MTQENYPIHPAAELFPKMSETEYEGLKEDIRLHGQREKIILCGKELIDGRHRLRACLELGIEPAFAELPKSMDPIAWVLSHNLHRRHLTTAQRAMVAAKLATLRHGEAGNGRKVDASIDASTQEDAAEQLSVSRKSVQRARKVQDTASADVIAEVEAGKMSLNAAVATTKASEAEKKAKAKAKAEKEKAMAEAKAEREKAKAAKAVEKEKAEAAKAKEKAEKEARIAAARTPEGQITSIKNMINQHLGKMVRLIDDLHRMKPNQARLDANLKCLQGIKLW